MESLAVISSWSGGKDSCLACYKAIQRGYEVKYLLNFISKETKRCCFHGIESKLMNAQAISIGIPLIQKEVSPDMQKYEEEFKSAVSELKSSGIKGMVFGDIYLDEHKNWIERVCASIEIIPIEPLWNLATENILNEFINLGFKAIVISAKADLLDKKFLGRLVDKEFIKELKQRDICLCGENGEFHTLVIDGPIFSKKIKIIEYQPVLKETFWKYWFLDIQKWEVEDKT